MPCTQRRCLECYRLLREPLCATSCKNTGARMIFLCVTSTTLMTLRVKLFDSRCYVNMGNKMTSLLKKK